MFSLVIGFVALLVTPLPLVYNPSIRSHSGAFTLSDSQNRVVSVNSIADRIVIVQFTAEIAAIEFFVVHSDLYDLAGLPDIALCQYHTVAGSGSCQFFVDSADTWYLVFANSPQNQEISYEWVEYTAAEWNTRQAINLAIVLGSIIVISTIIVKIVKNRASRQ